MIAKEKSLGAPSVRALCERVGLLRCQLKALQLTTRDPFLVVAPPKRVPHPSSTWVGLLLALISLPALAQTQPIAKLLLWPSGNPEPSTITAPETDPSTDRDRMVFGKPVIRVTNVTKPDLAVYPPPAANNTGAAALVLPAGSYTRLNMNLDGTEICDWLNSVGMTCVLVRYRVPETQHYPENTEDLEDAQQAMRLTRAHAAEWHIDPRKIGVMGFSAGAHLAVALSTHPDFENPAATAASGFTAPLPDARPNFQMIFYPGWLTGKDMHAATSLTPNANTPPTFLLQAENDYAAHVENSLAYFLSLKDAHVPAEMHLYTLGGHDFGLRPTQLPVGAWPTLAETWLHSIHILGPPGEVVKP